MTLLEQSIKMQKLSFYESYYANMTVQESEAWDTYHKIVEEIKKDSKLLKKGDNVQFNFPKQIKDKTVKFGFRLENNVMKGVVKIPYKIRKKSRMGEDASYPLLKVISGGYVYEVSPDSIVKI